MARSTPRLARGEYATGLLGHDRLFAAFMERRAPPRRVRADSCSSWGGFGGVVLVEAARGPVRADTWRTFVALIENAEKTDFFQGLDGAVPALAAAAKQKPDGPAVVELVFGRVAENLERQLRAHDAGASINLGFAHGVAGSLCALEMVGRLAGRRPTRLRRRAIAVLQGAAFERPAGAVWASHSRAPKGSVLHGLCNGGPGICLGALLAARYSGSLDYAPLIEKALPTVPIVTADQSFCCGTLGRIEIVIEAYRTTGEKSLLALARSLFAQVRAEQLRGTGWQRAVQLRPHRAAARRAVRRFAWVATARRTALSPDLASVRVRGSQNPWLSPSTP